MFLSATGISKWIIVCLWGVCFCILNAISKQFMLNLPVQNGFISIVKYALTTYYLYSCVALYAVCSLTYLALLRIMPLVFVGPLICILGVVLTTTLGLVLFGETLSALGWVGLALCISGIICMSLA